MHSYTQRGSVLSSQLQEQFKNDMLKKLEKKPWIADHSTSPISVCGTCAEGKTL